jgi:membrane protease YdiL (CAAX protease family)|tara:strand:+ start:1388 stop:2023 length:636 start_codon:yes stop_codon:yes gene_type:complete
MKTTSYLVTEFFTLFILLPLSFAIDYPILLKAILAGFGFLYILFVLKRVERISFGLGKNLAWKPFLKRMGATFIVVAVVTTAFVLISDSSALFYVPLNKPGLFFMILFVYTFLSVWPQEIIYRTFFMNRYARLFKSKYLLVFINAVLFSLAHLFFRNTLVSVLTLIGGLLFALTFLKYKSTLFVSIEHALYGNWLFTVGMGEMLAFPGMEM